MLTTLKENQKIELTSLIELYADAGWDNYTNNPEMLKNAFEHSLFTVSAWNENELTGLIRVVGDGYSIIYIQDILVKTQYQGQGIGSRLIEAVQKRYESVYQKVLLTDNQEKTVSFYEKVGFVPATKFGCISFVSFHE